MKQVIDLSSIQNDKVFNEEPQQEQLQKEEIEFSTSRAEKIISLRAYIQDFPDKLSAYNELPLHQLTEKQLDSLKEEIKTLLAYQSNINNAVYTFGKIVIISEQLLCHYTPLKVQGLSGILNDKVLLDDVKMWAHENLDLIKTKPEHRIIISLAQSILLLHNNNSEKEAEAEKANPKTAKEKEEIAKKIDDLKNKAEYKDL